MLSIRLRNGLGSLRNLVSCSMSSVETRAQMGKHVFRGAVAEEFLVGVGLPADTLKDSNWPKKHSDKVAEAVKKWALSHNATSYTHWFQPLGTSASGGVRKGLAGQVQISMLDFGDTGKLEVNFKGKHLCQGEVDGSSFPHAGKLRETHRSAGFTCIDTSSPIFLRGDVIFIPSCAASFNGHALDEKTPLLRSNKALSKEGTRLLNLLGVHCNSVEAKIGLEQEFFLVPRSDYLKRLDLKMTGRAVMGGIGVRGQEMCDHYMSAMAPAVLPCMIEIQRQAYNIGIPLRTRHREVAPGQYEFSPTFGPVSEHVDQNLMLMQIIDEVSAEYGLAALFHEKPFDGVNGSGKHNNWSLFTDTGIALLNAEDVQEKTGSSNIFPTIMAAVVEAVCHHGDLLRMTIAASPGNDFRLGACEAPPAIMSMYLGEDVTEYLQSYAQSSGRSEAHPNYSPKCKELDYGTDMVPSIRIPAEDRNRTSPFAYGGHRFEFRAVGSAQNVSIVNVVLATTVADVFRKFSDAIEAGELDRANPEAVAIKCKRVVGDSLNEAMRVVFNGNNYDTAEQQKLVDNHKLLNIECGVDAIDVMCNAKNTALFEKHSVLTPIELEARRDILLIQYINTILMEAKCMTRMIADGKTVAQSDLELKNTAVNDLRSTVVELQSKLDNVPMGHGSPQDAEEASLYVIAKAAHALRFKDMKSLSDDINEANEADVAFPNVPSISDMLFIDQ